MTGKVVTSIEAWQCIGCGKLEAPQPCIGVCQDRKVTLVSAADYQAALDQNRLLLHRIDALRLLLTRFTHARPHRKGYAASWMKMQDLARQALDQDEVSAHR